jgi:hypothetical protein
MIQSREIRSWNATAMEEIRNVYKFDRENLKGGDHWEDLGVEGRTKDPIGKEMKDEDFINLAQVLDNLCAVTNSEINFSVK